MEDLDEPEAKASLIWILGEYAEKIDNSNELLSYFLNSFSDEEIIVQIQILTSIVKLYLKKPDSNQNLVQKVLELSTKNCDNPDIRDRAYVYWRLLSTDPEAAKVSCILLLHFPSILPKSPPGCERSWRESETANNLCFMYSVHNCSLSF